MKRTLFTAFMVLFVSGYVYSDTMTIVSDTSTTWDSGTPALLAWVHPDWPSISGAKWIWVDYRVDSESEFGPFDFKREFTLPSDAVGLSGSIQITTDNAYELYINGLYVGGDGTVSSPPITHDDDPLHVSRWSSVETYSFTPKTGVNQILVKAVNYGGWVNPDTNPAGVLYKADIEYKIPAPAPEFPSIAVAAAILLTAPAFAYLIVKRRK